jgi:hypothetical protein
VSAPTYSCTMPEHRSADHIDRLLLITGLFTAAALVSGWTTYLVREYLVLAIVGGVLCLLSSAAAAICFWVWKDVHNDAG